MRFGIKPCATILLTLFILNLSLALPSSFVTVNTTGSVVLIQPLHTDGRYIKNANGKLVFLRGVNKGGWGDTSTGDWTPEGKVFGTNNTYWDDSTVRLHLGQLREWGSNAMRIMLNIDWWVRNASEYLWGPQQTNKPYRYCLEKTIDLAAEYGIYVVVSVWTVYPGHRVELPYNATNPDTGQPFTETDFINFWVDIASVLGKYPNVVFELYNEPYGGEKAFTHWADVSQQAVNSIRDVEKINRYSLHLIVVQYGYTFPPIYATWQQRLLNGSGILYSTHLYDGGFRYGWGNMTDISSSWWTYDSVKLRIAQLGIKNLVEINDVPFYAGEVGAYYANLPSPDPHQLEFFQNVLTVLNEWGASYTAFVFDVPFTVYALQQNTVAPFPPNTVGQTLINATSAGKAMGIVTGTVTDLNTGNVVQDVLVSIGGMNVTTGRSGMYWISVAFGEYTVTYEKSGYSPSSSNIVVSDSRSIYQINIQLSPS